MPLPLDAFVTKIIKLLTPKRKRIYFKAIDFIELKERLSMDEVSS